MSAPLQLHDIACLPAPPFGQALDVLLRVMPLNGRQRLLVQAAPVEEILDRADAGVDDGDLAVLSQSVDRADHAVRYRAEPLRALADQFRGFRHLAPRCPASMCGNVQNVAPNLGSTLKVEISWDVFAHPTQNSRVPTARTAAGRPIPPGPHAPLPTHNPVRGPVGTACASAQAFYSAVRA